MSADDNHNITFEPCFQTHSNIILSMPSQNDLWITITYILSANLGPSFSYCGFLFTIIIKSGLSHSMGLQVLSPEPLIILSDNTHHQGKKIFHYHRLILIYQRFALKQMNNNKNNHLCTTMINLLYVLIYYQKNDKS